MPAPWRESWIWFRRDLQRGELTLLLAALILAVAATTSLRFFSSGLEKNLRLEAARLIAADLAIRGSRPLAPQILAAARVQQFVTAQTLEFSSVLIRDTRFQLAAVKAAGSGYPLRGALRLQQGNGEKVVHDIPVPGTLWVDERLLTLLGASVGDSLQLGDKTFRIAAVLSFEPDRSNFISLAPRALMNLDDVAATGVIQPGSRVQYQLLLNGDEAALAKFRADIASWLGVGTKVLDVSSGRPEIAAPLMQVSHYLGLAAMVTVLLSGLAIAVTSRRFAERHFDTLALLRCFGATRREAMQRLLGEMMLLWLIATLCGLLSGMLSAHFISRMLAQLVPGGAPVLTLWAPLLTGIATASLCLAGFALPPLLALGRVTPLRVLRRELAPPGWSARAVTLLALGTLLLLVIMETGESELALIVVAGGGMLALAIHRGLVALLEHLRHRYSSPSLAGLARRSGATATQILGLSLGLAALLLMTSLRGELLDSWQKKLPPKAPNQFAINIAAAEKQAFAAALDDNGLQHAPLYPVVRARLTAINNRTVQAVTAQERAREKGKDGGARDESLDRELNLTWSDTLPAGNRLIAGHWLRAAPAGQTPVSIEKKLAERLGMKPGDRLHFVLAEGELDATVTSVRELDWDNLQPNFYFVFPPGTLEHFPANYLTSFYLPPGRHDVLNVLVHRFPTVVMIDVASLMTEIRHLLDQVAQAVEAVLGFVLASGLLVIVAHVLAGADARREEAALLRVIGASRAELRRRALIELLLLGGTAGLVAAAVNEIIAAVVNIRVLDVAPVLHPVLWWQAPLAGALLVATSGLLAMRQVWIASPLLALRRG